MKPSCQLVDWHPAPIVDVCARSLAAAAAKMLIRSNVTALIDGIPTIHLKKLLCKIHIFTSQRASFLMTDIEQCCINAINLFSFQRKNSQTKASLSYRGDCVTRFSLRNANNSDSRVWFLVNTLLSLPPR